MSFDVLGNVRIAIIPRTEMLPPPSPRRIEPVSERALFRGYSGGGELPRIAARACVCGGAIDPGYETEIQAAVARHSAERRHLAWRERQG